MDTTTETKLIDVAKVWAALYAINRAMPIGAKASYTDLVNLHAARDHIWSVLKKYDPEHARD